jgi:putative addiction module component (TIGR02574 family)
MSTARDLLAEALELTVDERLRLATELLNSVEGNEEEWSKAWSDELDRRAAEVDRGEVELLDARQVMADIRADLKDS